MLSLEAYTLRDCVEMAGAKLVYCSLYDAAYKGQYEEIVIEHNGIQHTFMSIRRAKVFLYLLALDSVTK